MQRYFARFSLFIASNIFFRLIVVGLVLSASWIALTGRYPMAFDEDFHFGLIRLYASHGLPFWSGQPANADAFGAVARDPSYLYHYLMSFVYQFLSLFTQNQTVQVIILRAINIAFLASSLPIFGRLLHQAGASRAVTNACLAMFVLVPITPFLAAQINYDNLLMPLTALLLLRLLQFKNRASADRPQALLVILSLGMFGSLIKFAFLPIFAATIVWLIYTNHPRSWSFSNWPAFWRPILRSSKGIILILVVLILGALSLERYGLNVVRYHDPVPNCGIVLPLENCKSYGPYIRDYNFAANKINHNTGPVTYLKEWLYGTWLRSLFALDGPTTQFQTRGPLVLPAYGTIGLLTIGAAAILLSGRRLYRRNPAAVSLFGAIIVVYTLVLWLQQYKLFVRTGVPVAINGRYMLLVLIPLLYLSVMSLNELLGKRQDAKILVLVLSLLFIGWGGGALTFILRSNDAWYWPNPVVRSVNHGVQNVIGPVTPGYYKSDAFLRY